MNFYYKHSFARCVYRRIMFNFPYEDLYRGSDLRDVKLSRLGYCKWNTMMADLSE